MSSVVLLEALDELDFMTQPNFQGWGRVFPLTKKNPFLQTGEGKW